jgi:hypothetical protein
MLAINVFRDTPMVYFVTEKTQTGLDRFDRLRPIRICAQFYRLLHAFQDADYTSKTNSVTMRLRRPSQSRGLQHCQRCRLIILTSIE